MALSRLKQGSILLGRAIVLQQHSAFGCMRCSASACASRFSDDVIGSRMDSGASWSTAINSPLGYPEAVNSSRIRSASILERENIPAVVRHCNAATLYLKPLQDGGYTARFRRADASFGCPPISP